MGKVFSMNSSAEAMVLDEDFYRDSILNAIDALQAGDTGKAKAGLLDLLGEIEDSMMAKLKAGTDHAESKSCGGDCKCQPTKATPGIHRVLNIRGCGIHIMSDGLRNGAHLVGLDLLTGNFGVYFNLDDAEKLSAGDPRRVIIRAEGDEELKTLARAFSEASAVIVEALTT
jgi:hypothetical protein